MLLIGILIGIVVGFVVGYLIGIKKHTHIQKSGDFSEQIQIHNQ